jgi:hypothetical protein
MNAMSLLEHQIGHKSERHPVPDQALEYCQSARHDECVYEQRCSYGHKEANAAIQELEMQLPL